MGPIQLAHEGQPDRATPTEVRTGTPAVPASPEGGVAERPPSGHFPVRPAFAVPLRGRAPPPPESSRRGEDMDPRNPPARLRVLVVDDDADTRETVAYLVGLWGYAVRTAPNGPAALGLAYAFRPDVILLDVAMPGMTGWEVARRLRRDPDLRDAYVVSISGYARNDDICASRAAGCDQHWAKPFDPGRLRELLANRHAEAGRRPG